MTELVWCLALGWCFAGVIFALWLVGEIVINAIVNKYRKHRDNK